MFPGGMDKTCDAADKHDPSACLPQGGQGGPDEQGRSEHVGHDHLAPAFGVAVGEGVMGGEVGNIVAFVASDKAGAMTGTVVQIDCGSS